MWKKTAGIISFVASFILFMVYFATIENSKSSRSEYEDIIRIQQRAIDRYNDYIEDCKDARSDANNVRLTIISMQEAISKLKARDIVLIVIGIVPDTAG